MNLSKIIQLAFNIPISADENKSTDNEFTTMYAIFDENTDRSHVNSSIKSYQDSCGKSSKYNKDIIFCTPEQFRNVFRSILMSPKILKSTENFIEKHNRKFRNYCEIIVTSTGEILYADPSHVYRLMMFYGIDKTDIYSLSDKFEEVKSKIPTDASPVHWLSEDLGAAICWYNSIIFPFDYTDVQLQVIYELIANKCICNSPNISISTEKTLINLKNSEQFDKYEFICNLKKYKQQELETLFNIK